LSLAYAAAGRSEDAVQTAHDATQNNKDPGVAILAGRAMLAVHRNDDARAFFNEALELDPKNREAGARLQAMEPRR
jgi:Flp pilus assembly protein TadD